jgi:hypothetical protein
MIVWELDLQIPMQDVMSSNPHQSEVYSIMLYNLSVTALWFSPGPQVSITTKTDRHDLTEILLKVALNIIKPPTSLQKSISNVLVFNNMKLRT